VFSRAAWIRVAVIAAALGVVAACGYSVSSTLVDRTEPSSARVEAATSASIMAANQLRVASTAAARTEFEQGLEQYCGRFYASERRADQQHPGQDRESLLAFDATVVRAASRTERLLDDLRPPPSLTETFSHFRHNAHEIYEARVALARADASGNVSVATIQLQTAVEERHSLARALGAGGCDDQLPPVERTGAVAATRAYDLTTNPQEGCADLVTPEFVSTQWADTADPMAACRADQEDRGHDPDRVARDIEVSEVTGADGLTAVVHFVETGGCCPGQKTVARLHLLDGTWKVRSISYE
jgi:hypothetical protein